MACLIEGIYTVWMGLGAGTGSKIHALRAGLSLLVLALVEVPFSTVALAMFS